jgi:hypothetical protein
MKSMGDGGTQPGSVCEQRSELLERTRRRLARQYRATDWGWEFDVLPLDAAWAAGLFAGEGYCGVITRGQRKYMNLQVGMLDERSVARFAAMFGMKMITLPLSYDRSRKLFRITASGRSAERILTVMWPFLEGTAKGDQVEAACRKVGVFAWVTGEATTPRVPRDGGNQWNGRSHTPETKAKMAAAKRAWWESHRNAP